MSKLTITITEEAHPILKEWAKKDVRTLSNYITCLFDTITGVRDDLDVYLPIEITHTEETHTVTKPITKITRIDNK